MRLHPDLASSLDFGSRPERGAVRWPLAKRRVQFKTAYLSMLRSNME